VHDAILSHFLGGYCGASNLGLRIKLVLGLAFSDYVHYAVLWVTRKSKK
jgi:hypothetical protein